MKLEVGMYVRTNMGDISKIKSIWENERVFFENKVDIDYFTSDSFNISYLKECKASFNIIDLIKVGDYVNGYKVKSVFEINGISYIEKQISDHFGTHDLNFIREDQIKSIVTKEQFASMEYKLDDSNA